MIPVARLELLRSGHAYLVLPLLAVQVVGMRSALDDWAGTWSAASVAVAWPGFIIAAALAGSTSLAAVSRTRRGESILANAVRPRWQLEAAMLLPPVLISVVLVIAGIVTAQVMAWPTASSGAGWLRLGFAVIEWSYLLLAIAIGHVAGRLVASWWTPAVAALGVLAVAVTVTNSDGLLFVPLQAPLHLRLSHHAVLLLLVAAVLALASASAGFRARQHAGGRVAIRVAVLPTGAAIVGALLVAASGTPLHLPRADQPDPLCTDGTPQICVVPEAPGVLSEARAMAERIAALPPGTYTAPERIEQLGVSDSPDAPAFALEGDRWFLADSLAGILATHSGRYCTPVDDAAAAASSAEYFTALEWLAARIHGGPRPAHVHSTIDDVVDLEEIARVLNQPDPEQAAWVSDRLTRMERACVGEVP